MKLISPCLYSEHVLVTVSCNRLEAHPRKERAHRGWVRCGVFDELEPVGAHRVVPGCVLHGSSFVVEADALERDCRFVAAQVLGKFSLGRPMDCRKRVKRLEETGIVTGYVAVLAAERVDLPLTAYLIVPLEGHTERHKRNPMDVFRAAAQTWPELAGSKGQFRARPGEEHERARGLTTAGGADAPCPITWSDPRPTANSLHGVLAVTLALRSALNISAARAASADTFCCHDA